MLSRRVKIAYYVRIWSMLTVLQLQCLVSSLELSTADARKLELEEQIRDLLGVVDH